MIHKEFVKIADQHLDDFMKEMGIDSETALKTIAIGVNIPEYKEIFDQQFLQDNFLVFKKQMVKRNKELELEALEEQKRVQRQEDPKPKIEQVQAQPKGGDVNNSFEFEESAEDEEEQRTRLEQEKADLDYCIEMSKIQQSDMAKLEGMYFIITFIR